MKINNRILKEKLKKSIESSAPNVLPEVLQYMEDTKERNENIVNTRIYRRASLRERTKNRYNKNLTLRIVSLAMALMMVLGIKKTYGHLSTESIINFDISPSIEMKVNSFQKVLSLNPLNEDARIVVGDMKFINKDLNIAVNALIDSMVANGYISSSKNSILISVYSNNREKGSLLQQKLSEDINTLLSQYEVKGSVLSQSIEDKSHIKEIAKKHDISTGKATLIQSFISLDNEKQFEAMASLSINDLSLLMEDKYTSIQGVSKLGAANDIYIGREKAKEIVLAHEKIEKDKIQSLDVEIDYGKGRMIYQVKFKANNTSYQYEIDAISGNILVFEREAETPSVKPEIPSDEKPNIEKPYIDLDKARDIALNHAELKDDQVNDLEAKLEKQNDLMIYKVEFKTDNRKYQYEIDAISGKILKTEKTPGPSSTKPEVPPNEKPNIENPYIDSAKAKEISLKHAELKEEQVNDLEAKLENENELMIYKVEFKTDNRSYQYKIDAISGKILKNEKTPGPSSTKPEVPANEKVNKVN